MDVDGYVRSPAVLSHLQGQWYLLNKRVDSTAGLGVLKDRKISLLTPRLELLSVHMI